MYHHHNTYCLRVLSLSLSLSTQLLLYSLRGLRCVVCVRAAVAVGVGLL